MDSHALPPPGTGYFVRAEDERAPGVLLLPSPWGLTDATKDKANELADAGFSVLAPDLNHGEVATSPEQARQLLLDADMNVTASLVQSSLRLLRAATTRPNDPVGLLGYAAGASWALWLSVRFADQVRAVTTFYGAQSIEFDGAIASFLLHFAEHDDDITDEESAVMGLNLQLARLDFRVEQHAGVSAGFAEPHHPAYDGAAEAVAWRQTMEFFAQNLK